MYVIVCYYSNKLFYIILDFIIILFVFCLQDKENVINLQKTMPVKRTAAGTIVSVLKEVQHKVIPAVSASNITAVIVCIIF